MGVGVDRFFPQEAFAAFLSAIRNSAANYNRWIELCDSGATAPQIFQIASSLQNTINAVDGSDGVVSKISDLPLFRSYAETQYGESRDIVQLYNAWKAIAENIIQLISNNVTVEGNFVDGFAVIDSATLAPLRAQILTLQTAANW